MKMGKVATVSVLAIAVACAMRVTEIVKMVFQGGLMVLKVEK